MARRSAFCVLRIPITQARDPVDAAVKKVQTDVSHAEQIMPYQLPGDVQKLIVHDDDVIAVPTNRTAYVQQNALGKKRE